MSCLMYGDQAIAGLMPGREEGTVTAGSYVHMGSRTSVIKEGDIYYINVVIVTDSAIPRNAVIANLPFNLEACYIMGHLDNDGSAIMMNVMNGTELIYQFGTIPSGDVIRIGATVIK